jgi:hypothetical protein
MFDPTTIIRMKDNSLKEISQVKAGEEFYDREGVVRPIVEVVYKENSTRFKLRTGDHRTVIVSGEQPWVTVSNNNKLNRNGDGEETPRIYNTSEIAVKADYTTRANIMRFLLPLLNPYSINEPNLVEPELRAIVETMGTAKFLDVTDNKLWKKRIGNLTPLKRSSSMYWYEFNHTIDYTPFRIHPSVFTAPLEYRIRYLQAVFYLCGEFKTRVLAYLAHPKQEFLTDIRSLVWSIGGITPDAYSPVKMMIQKSASFIGGPNCYTRLHCREINEIVPGNYFKALTRYSLSIHAREELEPGPTISLVSDTSCYVLTNQYLPLYLPEW